ncbi:MAG: 3-deoxy-manno-octulosonate cytidylyltransferase [bacterium]|nr:3-deoxy-manno-octulosonate cytidylyltransferase [bacterium]
MKTKKQNKAVGIIPARYGSSRFPGKPLAMIAGKPMIRRVYENALKANLLDDVFVATDDDRIASIIREIDGKYIMTDSAIDTGTERVAIAARDIEADIILNIQGDEPLAPPELLDNLINAMSADDGIPVSTPVVQIESVRDLEDPNQVRVAIDKHNRALYFTRSVIPYNRDLRDPEDWLRKTVYWKHIGIYCFRKDFLLEFVSMPKGELEMIEKLEQLRILENGYPILAVKTDYSPVCVDVPEDIDIVEKHLMNM